MTRFARAKGSKSSNEKTPEDSTPWEVMKDQLLQAKKEKDDSKNRKEAEKQRIENYENFLKEHRVQKRKATWCDFPETAVNKLNTADNKKNSDTPVKKKKKNNQNNNEKQTTNESAHIPAKETTIDLNIQDNPKTGNKNKKKKKKNQPPNTPQPDENGTNEIQTTATVANINKQANDKKGNKKKNKEKHNQTNKMHEINEAKSENENNQNKAVQSIKKKKAKKFVDGKPVRRKEENDRSFQLIINGKEIQLVKVDGFPVMKKDADRLQELRNNMIQKGIPKSEIQRTMKLERRRAEKALARIKRDVCYNCRKGGHNLSDCPDLKSKIPSAEGGEGICFKCGSTEHRQFECKVQRDKEFRFATCFICREPGHIARQCPDNPKGLYPNGGSCKLCGDVTHLRKDCPTVTEKKEEKSIKLQTLDSNDDVEGIGQDNGVSSEKVSKKAKKIKF